LEKRRISAEPVVMNSGVVSYYVGLAVLVILLVIALVAAYRVWSEIHDVEEPDSPEDLLESFEQAHAAGVLDDRELARVRWRLTGDSTRGDAPQREGLSGDSQASAEGQAAAPEAVEGDHDTH
jgi:hypothetical protein